MHSFFILDAQKYDVIGFEMFSDAQIETIKNWMLNRYMDHENKTDAHQYIWHILLPAAVEYLICKIKGIQPEEILKAIDDNITHQIDDMYSDDDNEDIEMQMSRKNPSTNEYEVVRLLHLFYWLGDFN